MNHLQSKTAQLKDNSAKVCMKLNAQKCKVLKVNSKSEASLTAGKSDAKEVDRITYLGVNVTKDERSTADIKKRIAMAGASFWRL